MSVNEQMVQDIVQEVMAKMQIASEVTGNHGEIGRASCRERVSPYV